MGSCLPDNITKSQIAISTLLNQIATTSLPAQSTLYVVDPAAAGVVVAVVGGVVDVVLCHTYVLLEIWVDPILQERHIALNSLRLIQ